MGASARFVSMPSKKGSGFSRVLLLWSRAAPGIARFNSSCLIIRSSCSFSVFDAAFLMSAGGIVNLRFSFLIAPMARLGTTLLSRKNCFSGSITSD